MLFCTSTSSMSHTENKMDFCAYWKLCDDYANFSGSKNRRPVRKNTKKQTPQLGKCLFVGKVFQEWFIGFFEGDGSLIKTKGGNLMFVITQN